MLGISSVRKTRASSIIQERYSETAFRVSFQRISSRYFLRVPILNCFRIPVGILINIASSCDTALRFPLPKLGFPQLRVCPASSKLGISLTVPKLFSLLVLPSLFFPPLPYFLAVQFGRFQVLLAIN